MSDPLDMRIAQLEAWLPQTQCEQCGYAGCRPYAEALAEGRAEINQCPPGGDVAIQGLADVLGVAPKPLAAAYAPAPPRALALIDEAACIGCTLCIQACPVDAILGAAKQMHSVLAAECTGCALCLPPCPVDCILMLPTAANHAGPWAEYGRAEAAHWQRRAQARRARVSGRRPERSRHSADIPSGTPTPAMSADSARKKAEIRAAVARVQAKRRQ